MTTTAAPADGLDAHRPDPWIGALVGRYRIESRLGDGGMGVVYRAFDDQLNRPVALKFLDAGFRGDREADARFIAEARAASALDHPNICTIYEIGEATDGSRFIAMAYYPGQTLKDLAAGSRLTPAVAVAVARQVASALARAHEAGIVHRDVKPANVMVTDRGLVKLLDFGIAKLASEADPTGAVAGTLAYMSPEQLSGEAVDGRTDVWALGVVLYEVLAGRRPFEGNHAALLYAVLQAEPEPLDRVAPGLPEGLVRLVHKCLARSPDDRYPSAEVVAADLRTLEGGQVSALSTALWPDGSAAMLAAEVGAAATTGGWRDRSGSSTGGHGGRDRTRELVLLQKVRQFWIEGVLERSLHHQSLISLGRDARPEAIDHPWEQVLELPDRAGRLVEPGRGIGALFDEVGRSLLVLGEPGAGKTVTMLDLARTLLDRAEADAAQPVPVVLNLSSWQPRLGLADWICEELSAKYQVPRRLGQRWLEEDRLLPLLDGLDEVAGAQRAGCVTAINAFLEEYGPPGLAVSSRVEDYTALPSRLRLYAAIALRPLTPGQVVEHLDRLGPSVAGLATAMAANPALLELAQSPLMLDVMTVAYADRPDDSLSGLIRADGPAQQGQLFDSYVERMFQRRRAAAPYTREQTTTWLSALARAMARRAQTVFLIEQLQPSWLPTGAQRWQYTFLTRIVAGMLLGGLIGLSAGITASLLQAFRTGPDGAVALGPMLRIFFGTGTMLGVVPSTLSGLAFGAGSGLFLALLDGRRIAAGTPVLAERTPGRLLLRGVVVTLGCAGFGGAMVALGWGMREGIEVGLLFGLLFGVVWGTREHGARPEDDIHPVEALSWSGRRARSGVVAGFLLGVSVGSAVAALFALLGRGSRESLLEIAAVGLVWGVAYAAIGAFFGGLVTDVVRGKTGLNQGIALSLRNAATMGLRFGLIAAVAQGVVTWLIEDAFAGLAVGIMLGGSTAATAAMWYGGLDVIHHYVLRAMLAARGYMPREVEAFLGHAQQLAFLQRAGGGVLFVHRLMLEYFAGMGRERAG
jgi:hypothetical protein